MEPLATFAPDHFSPTRSLLQDTAAEEFREETHQSQTGNIIMSDYYYAPAETIYSSLVKRRCINERVILRFLIKEKKMETSSLKAKFASISHSLFLFQFPLRPKCIGKMSAMLT